MLFVTLPILLPILGLATTFVKATTLDIALTTADNQETGGYKCGPDTPCPNAACCGASGWCGFGPTYCGDGCQSNCDATAECGQYATEAGAGCPLNVCCSEFGFCGTTSEFCGSGCQSHCTQPKPSGPSSNVQKRVIGYWEAWNTQHACGTMGPGEIPVSLLTHLNIAFGYIDDQFRITNMDGLSSKIYQTVGDLKARNPNLSIMIALGGWDFSDPGPWQSTFPTMVSNQENRATFIQNLLGFLSEYGYDGVDFDWEYPGAGDRGGSNSDGKNYSRLLKELRDAIDSSGKNYTVTFTAPTSYWYLRHFDLKEMTEYVDWVNLMAYDLHGVWDGDNPIGNQVLAHTNLTEIDQALDLFWRVDVDPSAIVLGLGFYGRSFQLTEGSCWKPGCKFNGPGKAGRCTNSPGILSYREITDILDNIGGQSYMDKEAAVRYIVYDSNNWISFDDETTFKMKIDYANKMGLSGLMVWAVDLDDNYLHALRAVSDVDGASNTFNLVDLENLFPPEQLPPPGTVPSYGLTTFGGTGNGMEPGDGGFGFLLFAGDSYAVSQLRKREGLPDPFVFLDCPSDVLTRPGNDTFTARVICLSEDIAGCFRVTERGVEGTLVEMPDDCAPNTIARAISLKESAGQYVPSHIQKRSPTSQVFDFQFDFNLDLMRRDTDNTSIRLDYSNVAGYWDNMVDSPGVSSNDRNFRRDLVERFWSPQSTRWKKEYTQWNTADYHYQSENALHVKEDIGAPIFWQTVEQCPVDGESFSEGFGAFVAGTVDAEFYFGMSLVGTMTRINADWLVKEMNSFLTVDGTTDITYGIGGLGAIDITKANKGNPAISEESIVKLKGTTIDAGAARSSVTFNPYYQVSYQMATFNGTEVEDYTNAAAPFNGLISTRVLSDLGNLTAYFPPPSADTIEGQVERRNSNKISTGSDNVLYDAPGDGGRIALGVFVRFGLSVDFGMFGPMRSITSRLLNAQLVYDNMMEVEFYPGDRDPTTNACTDYNVTTNIYQDTLKGDMAGWGEGLVQLTTDRQSPGSGQVCYPIDSSDSSNSKRDMIAMTGENNSHGESAVTEYKFPPNQKRGSIDMSGWGYDAGTAVDPLTYFGMESPANKMMNQQIAKFMCQSDECLGCSPRSEDSDEPPQCCGCVCMDCVWGYRDIPNCVNCHRNGPDGSWPGGGFLSSKRDISSGDDETSHELQRRSAGKATMTYKHVKFCGHDMYAFDSGRYPAFPRDASWPWEGIEGGAWDSVSRYWGNASADCSNWGVVAKQPADQTYIAPGRQARANYETEHVFEGQLIGDFFTQWLDKGKVNNQDPNPPNPQPKMACADSLRWMVQVTNRRWIVHGNPASFARVLLHELGSKAHLDRLTIFMGRPNGMKGSMFTGNQPVRLSSFNAMDEDEQLQAVKQMGMVFTYLNNQEVWDKFCSTYEAIYDLMGEFNTWYAANGPGTPIPNLQDEWNQYIRVSLDSMVRRSRKTFDGLYNARRQSVGPNFFHWFYNRLFNKQLIRLAKTCRNLDPTTV